MKVRIFRLECPGQHWATESFYLCQVAAPLTLCLLLLAHPGRASNQNLEYSDYCEGTHNLSEYPYELATYSGLMGLCSPNTLIFDRYVSMVLVLIGLVSNLLSALIWGKLFRHNSAAVYLVALSLNDFFVVLLHGRRVLERYWDIKSFTLEKNYKCTILRHIIPLTLQYASNVYVLAFTFERWFAVCFPFHTERICSPKRAAIISALICVLAFAVTLGLSPLTHNFEKCAFQGNGSYIIEAQEYFFTLFIPCLVLLLNILLIRLMIRMRNSERKLSQSNVNRCESSSKPATPTSNCWLPKNTDTFNDEDPYPAIENGQVKPKKSIVQALSKQFWKESKSKTSRQNGSASFKSTTIMLLIVSNYMVITCLLGGIMYTTQKLHNCEICDVSSPFFFFFSILNFKT
ncbi:hypothetical protein Ciccas_010629 [Cichlidogyrus casuarinus]|uniref:G-protein coupled receptors family 1 profile domain-containing protein n=1 Tax=Cichlidogyrus casuarinus TaxID=1844966 RepID=A0ABD2PTK2_9PLAT